MHNLHAMLENEFEEMVAIRRYLHERPELSFQEVHTPAYIANYHRELGLEVREGVGGRGVVATLRGGKPGKTVALRADFDALAIEEQTNLPFASKNRGAMHACGHDGHTATLLVLAKVLVSVREQISGTIVFIHQHAEEIAPGGAISMIEDGCLDGVDVIFGQHLWAPTPLGQVLVHEGPIMAAADRFEITVQGLGGHGAEPHNSVDSIVTTAHFITQLQTLVARRVDPLQSAVVSVGHLEALNPFNVIADIVALKGTVRTFNESVRALLEKEIEQLLAAVCAGAGASYQYDYVRGYPPVVNHPEETRFVADVARNIAEVEEVIDCPPFMIGEDFAYYLEKVPGTFFITGAKNPKWETVYPHHHGKFDFDERAMLTAAKVFADATIRFLEENSEK